MQNTRFLDWLALATLIVILGSVFMLTKLAVQELHPVTITAGRITLAAVILLSVTLVRKESFGFLRTAWPLIITLAIVGNCLPFYLVTWGQQTVDSGTAGILMSIIPLLTIVLAHFLIPEERLNRLKMLGFLIGFAGIIMLLGPVAMVNLEGSTYLVLPMLAILGGAVCHALHAVLAKGLPKESLLALAASVLVASAMIMIPIWFVFAGDDLINPLSLEFLAMVLLGIFPTAISTIIYFALIASAGPSFLSQMNYLIPLWALLIGILFLGETFSIHAFLALIVVLTGIAVAQK